MRKPLYSIWVTLVLSVSPPTLCDDSATAAAVTTCPVSVPELKPTPQPACSLSSEPVDLAPEFLSFEEWKEKMAQRAEVAKDLAAAEHDTTNEGQKEHETTNALNDPAHDQPPSPDTAAFAVPSAPLPRSHIPLIDRFNYASSECNARIQAADKFGKSAVSILTRTKDKYMLSPCQTSGQKFVVVELCEDIRIDTVQLANFEFFSGVFKDIRVSVAHAYTDDGQGWALLGEYKAKNIRGVQVGSPDASTDLSLTTRVYRLFIPPGTSRTFIATYELISCRIMAPNTTAQYPSSVSMGSRRWRSGNMMSGWRSGRRCMVGLPISLQHLLSLVVLWIPYQDRLRLSKRWRRTLG